jgi:DNA-binding response OmpR family regulator
VTADGTVLATVPGMATVAIINSSQDTVEMLRTLLEREGWQTVEGHADEIKRGRIDFLSYLETHDPTVVIWDVAPPYDQNWAFLRLVRSSRAMDGRVVIVTTTNKVALDRFAGGPTDALEIFTKPYDVDILIETITRLLRTERAS